MVEECVVLPVASNVVVAGEVTVVNSLDSTKFRIKGDHLNCKKI